MPSAAQKTLLCRYHYDPLDRLVNCTPSNQACLQRFYCKSRLASEIQGAIHTRFFQHGEQLLAEHQRQGANLDTRLLATDIQRSVLQSVSPDQRQSSAYSPYGYRTAENGLLNVLGFNGERADAVTGHYLMGNGYRAFNPVLMRFNSPDSLSPFGEGGFSSYAYCQGDPINQSDPTGHFIIFNAFASLVTTMTSALGLGVGLISQSRIGMALGAGGAAAGLATGAYVTSSVSTAVVTVGFAAAVKSVKVGMNTLRNQSTIKALNKIAASGFQQPAKKFHRSPRFLQKDCSPARYQN